jgi:hypothetical protein
VAVAQGEVPVQAIARAFAGLLPAGKANELPAGLAPAHGLMLVEVTYPGQESTEQ